MLVSAGPNKESYYFSYYLFITQDIIYIHNINQIKIQRFFPTNTIIFELVIYKMVKKTATMMIN